MKPYGKTIAQMIVVRFGCWAALAWGARAQGAAAQQQPVTTLPLDHMLLTRTQPRRVMDSLIHVSLWQRSPWTGVPSAPRTTSLALTSPTGIEILAGVGGPGYGATSPAPRGWQAFHMSAWPTRRDGPERWELSFGHGTWAGRSLRVDGNQDRAWNEAGDPVLGDTYQTVGVPDASAGLLLSGGARSSWRCPRVRVLGSAACLFTRAQIGGDSRLGVAPACTSCPTATAQEVGAGRPCCRCQHLRPIPAEWSAALCGWTTAATSGRWRGTAQRAQAIWAQGSRLNDQLTFSYNQELGDGQHWPRFSGGGHEVVLGFTVPR